MISNNKLNDDNKIENEDYGILFNKIVQTR